MAKGNKVVAVATGSAQAAATPAAPAAETKASKCPVTRKQFKGAAKPVTVAINGIPQAAMPKEFSTGSLGWFLNGKTTIEIDGVATPVQIGLNLTVIGSKELPAE